MPLLIATAHSRLFGLLAAAALCAVIAAACTGSSSTGPTTTTTPVVNTPPVTLSPTTVAFPITAVAGSTQAVTLTNTGTATLTISSIATSGNFKESDDCGTSVPVGAACTITVTFNPAVVGAGGALTITDDATTSPQSLTVTSPNVLPPGALLAPSSLAFGNQSVGTTSPAQTVTLTNPFNGVSLPLVINGPPFITGDFSIARNLCGTTLAPGASCSFTITFAPTATGTRTGFFQIIDNAPSLTQTVPLTGVGQ